MNKVINIRNAVKISKQLKRLRKRIVLVGGCFDILHIGHVQFLEKAKRQGDVLLVMLESDEKVRLLKGKNRPYHKQGERAKMLASLSVVDFVIFLPRFENDQKYDTLVSQISPTVIAVTEGDSLKRKKQKQAKRIGGRLIEVTKTISNKSTSRVAKLLSLEN